jgi:hypothetical protein
MPTAALSLFIADGAPFVRESHRMLHIPKGCGISPSTGINLSLIGVSRRSAAEENRVPLRA